MPEESVSTDGCDGSECKKDGPLRGRHAAWMGNGEGSRYEVEDRRSGVFFNASLLGRPSGRGRGGRRVVQAFHRHGVRQSRFWRDGATGRRWRVERAVRSGR